MKDLRKRYLVTPEEYQRIKTTSNRFDSKPYSIPHPDAKNAARNHSALKNILSSENVSDFDKVLDYAQGLRRYLSDIKNAVTVPKSTAILGKPLRDPSPPPPPPPPPSPQPNLIDIDFQPTNTNIPDAFNTPVRNPLSTPLVPSTLNFSDPKDKVTPSSTNSKKSRKSKAGRFSQEKILERVDDKDQKKVGDIFHQLSQIPQFSWNKTTGVPTFGSQKLDTTIEALVNEYIIDKPATSSSKTFKKFKEIVNNPHSITHSGKKRRK